MSIQDSYTLKIKLSAFHLFDTQALVSYTLYIYMGPTGQILREWVVAIKFAYEFITFINSKANLIAFASAVNMHVYCILLHLEI